MEYLSFKTEEKVRALEHLLYKHYTFEEVRRIVGNLIKELKIANKPNKEYPPSGGIPKSDLSEDIQSSLNKADSALQTHQDISGKFDKSDVVNEAGSSTEKVMSQQAVTDGLTAIIDATTESLVTETQQRVAADAQLAVRVQIINRNDAEYTAGAFRGWLAYGQPSSEGIVKFAAGQCPLYTTATVALQCWYKWMAENQDGTNSDNGVKWLEKAIAANDPDVTYFIKPGWIVTNKDEGYIRISYKTIATDERGYPLVPDLTSYQEAVYWYIVMKLSFPKFLNGQLGGKGKGANQNAYFYIQQQGNFYRNQAYAEAMMPTSSDMESIKNEWNKLIPEWDSDQQFFSKVGQEPTVINDYYYGY